MIVLPLSERPDEKNVKVILDNEVNYMRKDFYKEHKSQANNIVIRKKY